jgi:hypothetical protein
MAESKSAALPLGYAPTTGRGYRQSPFRAIRPSAAHHQSGSAAASAMRASLAAPRSENSAEQVAPLPLIPAIKAPGSRTSRASTAPSSACSSRRHDCHAGHVGIAQNRLEFGERRTQTISEFVRCGMVGIAGRREGPKLGKITDPVAPIAAANGSDPHRFSARDRDFLSVQKNVPHATAVRVTGVPPERTATKPLPR